jgi:hypothetical protein
MLQVLPQSVAITLIDSEALQAYETFNLWSPISAHTPENPGQEQGRLGSTKRPAIPLP